MRPTVLIGGFSHETNAFSSERTGLDKFKARELLHGDEMFRLRHTNHEIAGFLAAAEAHGWRVRPSIAAAAMPSGLVTAEAFAFIASELVAAAAQSPAPDAILLFLHGAMVAEGITDGEGELLARLRAIVGSDIPIAAVLDLHANVTDRMAEQASLLMSYRTYPHIDLAERGREAADIIARALNDGRRLATVVARGPLIDGCNDGRTQGGPMVPLLARARDFECESGVLSVSINAGFPDSDIREAGPSVTVSGDAPRVRLQEIADDLMREIWDRRDEKTVEYLSPAEAVRRALAVTPGSGPVVIADYADNPGAGAYGDATDLLKAMLEARVENAAFGGLVDPVAARALHSAGVGAEVKLVLGGRHAPEQGGGPLTLEGTVLQVSGGTFTYRGPMWTGGIGSLGPTAALRVSGIDILVISENAQMLDEAMFLAGGIEPREKAVIGLKSMHHFRGAFEPMARAVLVCDTGALATPDYGRRPFRHLRRPVYPLDPVETCLATWRGG
ncbi:MAG: M81 family metallopeptidase [Hyphomicrobiaceae bacterium]